MDPLTTAALISAGSNVLGNIFNVSAQKSANNANMELAKYQYEKNLEMWNRQNEYNLPKNQVQRLKDADLNPVLAFSGGQVSGNVAQDSPSYDPPHIQPYQVDSSGLASIGSSFVNAMVQKQNIKLMESQEDLNRAKVATENMLALFRELQGTNQFMQNQYFEEVAPLLKQTVKANLDLIGARTDYTKSLKDMTDQEKSMIPVKIAQMNSQIKLFGAQTQLAYVHAAKVNIERVLLEYEEQYGATYAFNKANKGSLEILGLSKLNNLRDLEAVIKRLEAERIPAELKLKIYHAILETAMGTAKSASMFLFP